MITWRANKDAPDTAYAEASKHLLVVHGRSYAVLQLQDGSFAQPWRIVANGTATRADTARQECERAFERVTMTQEQRDQQRKDWIDEQRASSEKAGGTEPEPPGSKPRARRIP